MVSTIQAYIYHLFFFQLWLELWWVTAESRPDNFGSPSYFAKYERCHQLEPEHFVFHSTKRLDSRLNESVVNGGSVSEIVKVRY